MSDYYKLNFNENACFDIKINFGRADYSDVVPIKRAV